VPEPEAEPLGEGHGSQGQAHQQKGHGQNPVAQGSAVVRSNRAGQAGDVRGDLIKTIFTQIISYLLSMLHFLHAIIFHANKHLQALTSTEVGATQAGPLELATGWGSTNGIAVFCLT